MRKFLTGTCFALTCLLANAQFVLKGKIIDSTSNHPLPDATVELDKAQLAVADGNGIFFFKSVAAGNHTLEVRFVGYDAQFLNIYLKHDTVVEVPLVTNTMLKEEVIVSSTRTSSSGAFAFTNISKTALQQQNFGQDMPQLLNWTPSVVTTSDAGVGIGYTGMRIRGSDATRINVTINGIPYSDSESHATYWVNIPDIASSTQSVQIQRGVGTSANGGNAFGATVNLQTLTLQAEPYAQVTLGAGTFGTGRITAKGGTGLLNKRWSVDVSTSKIVSDGYVDRASSDLSSYYVNAGFHGNKTMVKVVLFGGHEVTYQAWYGLDAEMLKANRTFNYAGAIYNADGSIEYYKNQHDNYKQNHYQLHVSHRVAKNWTGNVSGHYTYGRGFYEEYHQAKALAELGLANYVIRDSVVEAMDVVVRKWLNNHFYGATFSVQYEGDKLDFTFGGAANSYANAKHFGELHWAHFAEAIKPDQVYYRGESHKSDLNLYAKAAYSINDKWSGFLDAQVRRVGYETKGIDNNQVSYAVDETYQFFNPKVGITYAVTPAHQLYGSYAMAHREPNRSDFLENATTPKRERLGDLELGWRLKKSRLQVEMNYYFMQYKNQLVLTGEQDDAGYPIRANIGKSYRTGLEASAAAAIGKFSLAGNATWALNQNQDFKGFDASSGSVEPRNTTIAFSPALIAGAQISFAPLQPLTICVLAKFVGRQYLDNTEDEALALDRYFVQDLRLSYSIKSRYTKHIKVSLLVNNILNEKYISNGVVYGSTPYYFPQAGINFLAMVEVRI